MSNKHVGTIQFESWVKLGLLDVALTNLFFHKLAVIASLLLFFYTFQTTLTPIAGSAIKRSARGAVSTILVPFSSELAIKARNLF